MARWPGLESRHPCSPFFHRGIFSPSIGVLPSTQKPAFPNFRSIRNGLDEHTLFRGAICESLSIYLTVYCGRHEEPAILISRFLLRMRRMYVARGDWNSTKNVWNAQNALWSRVFWPSVTWNLRKAQRWSKSFLTFDGCRPHFVTFGYY